MTLTAGQYFRSAIIAFALVGAPLGLFNIPLFLNAPEQDSFFTLSSMGSAGLALLSLSFLVLVFWVLGLKSKWMSDRLNGTAGAQRAIRITLDVAMGWLIFLLLHRLSPQLYYLYYMMLFDGLPMKWVVHADDEWLRLGATIIPGPKERLADFLACTGFWVVLPFTLMMHRASHPKA
jgi:hypothetical protein